MLFDLAIWSSYNTLEIMIFAEAASYSLRLVGMEEYFSFLFKVLASIEIRTSYWYKSVSTISRIGDIQ
jgi:hypothetical protein